MENSQSSKKNRQKSSILINPRFQWTLIGYAAFIAGLVLVSVYLLFSFGFHEFEQMGTQAGFASDHVYFQFIHMQEDIFQKVLSALALIVGLILVLGGLIISHKIAGPIYRMQKELNSMAAKDEVNLKPIHFRKGDFFPELSAAFNSMVEKKEKLAKNRTGSHD